MSDDHIRKPMFCCQEIRKQFDDGNLWLKNKKKVKIGYCYLDTDSGRVHDVYSFNCPHCGKPIVEDLGNNETVDGEVR